MPWYWPFAAKPKWELDAKLNGIGLGTLSGDIAISRCVGRCNGFPLTLVARNLAITTAHAAPMKGQRATFDTEQTHVLNVKPHPYYQAAGLYNDVALVRLAQPIRRATLARLLPEGWERDEVIPTLGYMHLNGRVSVEEYDAEASEPARLFFNRPAVKAREMWWLQAVSGDSNSPRFHLLKGRLYLISLYSTAGSPTQPSLGPRITREMVAEMRGLL